MATLFTDIIKGKIPCHKILEDENYLAFLDIRPINPGHTLVIPKREVDDIFELNDSTLTGLIIFAKKVSRLIKKEIPCKRIGVMVAGLEVPHAHIHLVPITAIAELNFSRAKPAQDQQLAQIAQRIRQHIPK